MGYLLKKDGTLSNFIDDNNQLKKGNVPWKGAREKHIEFLRIIFSILTNEGDIVMDW